MKINLKLFGLRLIVFPFKLALLIIWFFLLSVSVSFKWLFYGGQELFYSKNDFGGTIVQLIDSNTELINEIKKQS